MFLKGFLWSMGRCATKAVADSLTDASDCEATCWVDTAKIIEAPGFHLGLLDRPTVVTLHHPQFLDAFGKLLAQYRDLPVVFTVRDPIANLESFAQTFLTSFVARRVEEAAQHVSKGGSIVAAINPAALEQWLMPTSHLWRQYAAVKDSRHLVVDFSELGADHFAGTMTRIAEFLGLSCHSPFAWSGEANGQADRFLVGYARTFNVLDRKIELRFTRWQRYWGEPGLVSLGTLRSAILAPLVGAEGSLTVQAKSDQLLTHGRLDRELAAFGRLLETPEVAHALAAQVAADYAKTDEIVTRELPAMQANLVGQFERTQRDGVRRFLKAHPGLEPNWHRWQQAVLRKAA